MSIHSNYLSLTEAARYLGVTRRWMYRNTVKLVRDGVKVARLPLGAVKGRLSFDRASLEEYARKAQIHADFGVVDRILGSQPKGSGA